jgi:hypothetical protein
MRDSHNQSTGTTFTPKAYWHFGILIFAAALLVIVVRMVEPHLRPEDIAVVQWVLLTLGVIIALTAFATIHRHWATYAIAGHELEIRHKLYGTRKLDLSQITAAHLKDTQGGRNHRYPSIEITLANQMTIILDGLYNQGIEPFLGTLADRIQ